MDKKQLGAFYTPSHTVDYILKRVNEVTPVNQESKILEPSGGDGIFVSNLLSSYKIDPKSIDVWDINTEVKDKIMEFGVNFTCKDSLLETNFMSESLFAGSEGDKYYTHVIGNPPYLNKQSTYIKNKKHELRKLYGDIGVHDTYAMFIYLGSKLLKQGGCLGFIVSDTFLTLGIHKNFRKYILEKFSIKEITLCQKRLFEGAAVSTCILILENKKPTNETKFIINNCRNIPIGEYEGIKSEFNQFETLNNPDHVFDINNNSKYLKMANSDDKMVNYLEGGLGMHTKDNKKYLAIVEYDGIDYSKKKGVTNRIDAKDVDGKNRIFYHKQGGNYKYFLPAEYAVKWDDESVSNYVIPKYAFELKDRKGFLISGVCTCLCARLSTIGAMWESNKAMCFYPKNDEYPVEYFLGLLNSSIYTKIIKALNDTNSIQIRDIYKLPMIHLNSDDKSKVIDKVKLIINGLKTDLSFDFQKIQLEIDEIIAKYFD